MKKKFIVYLLLVIAFTSLACLVLSSDSSEGQNDDFSKFNRKDLPTTPGLYYIDNKEFRELPSNSSNDVDFRTSPHIVSQNPEFIVIGKEINPDTFNLYNHTGQPFDIIILELDPQPDSPDRKILQIKASMPLRDGFYCFSSDIFINPYFGKDNDIKPWCFSVGSNDQLGLDPYDGNFSPPSNQTGFYLFDNDEYSFITPNALGDEIDMSGLPIANQLFPVILFQSESVNPDYVQIYWRRPVIGVSLSLLGNYATITAVESNLGAESAGITAGDVIVTINSTDVTGWSNRQIRNKLSGDCLPEKTIDLNVLRGTQQFSAKVACSLSGGANLQNLSYVLHTEGYAIFTLSYPLYSGNVYCMYIPNSSEKHCFRIQ